MLISIHDSSLKRMAYMDNVVPLAMHYTDDTWRRLLKEATSTFIFKVDMLGRENEQYLTDNAYISFDYNGKTYLFNVMRITHDSGNKSIEVYCENLSLELLNEFKAPIDVTTSRNLEWYLNNDGLLNNAGLTLGVNEVSDKTAKIKLESEQTGLARLTSIANNFDAEVEFVTELNGDGTLKSMTVNFFKKYDGVSRGIGTYRRDLILEYGRNVDGIKQTVENLDLYNVITPTGKDGLNITSLEKEEYDDDGNLEYYTPAGVNRIYAPQSRNRYRAQLLNDIDGWLNRPYTSDGTSNVNTLYTLALNELKKHAYPAITYEVTGFYDLDIGDTVRIVDHSFTPTLIVQARVAEQSICFSDPTKNKTTFCNILALESRVSQDLTGRLKELVDQATPYRFEIVSDNGLTFKNSTGSTTLTARVYKGSNVDEVSVDSFEWLIDGVKFGGATKSQLVNASQVTGTSVVRYNAKIGDTVIGGLEVTIVDVSDGASGRGVEKVDQKWLVQSFSTVPTYAWSNSAWKTAIPTTTSTNKYLYTIERTTYTDATTSDAITLSAVYGDKGDAGANGSDGIAGKDGVGVKTTVITYSISTSGTTAPTTGWTSSVPSLVKGQYLWTKTVWTYTDNSSETGYSVTYISKDGNNGTDGVAGKDGVGISNTTIEYIGAVSGTSKPTSGWSTTIPTVPAGQYLWTRTTWQYTDGTSEQGFTNALMGRTGVSGKDGVAGKDGVGIKSTQIMYAQSTSGTTAPATGWTAQVPTLIKGRYLWTQTTWVYTDNTGESGYTVSYNAKDGNNGTDGIAGKDGVGIKTTTITYVGSTSGTTAPTSGWTSTVPTVAAGNYLWTKTVWAYTDNTSETGYSVAKMGNNGATGQQGLKGDPGANGIPGQAGADGKTSYLHIAYATNSTGTAGFDVSNATGKTYIGQYTDFTSADSTDPSKYTWSLIKGDKGDKGDRGIKGADGTNGTSGIIVSSVAPASPKTGQLWQDTSTIPQLVKKWTGTSWVIWELYAQNLKADTLETLSATIGKLKNTYTVDYGAGVHTGTVTIENGMKIVDDVGVSQTITDFTSQSSGQGMFARYLPNKNNTEKYQQAWYTPFSLRFDDTVNDWHGQITAENVTLVPWTNLTYLPGFTTAENNPCQYRKIKNLDGSFKIEFRGQIKPSSGSFAVKSTSYVASIPSDIMPLKNAFGIGIPDFNASQNVRLVVVADLSGSNPRQLQIKVTGGVTSYVSLDMLYYTI